MIRNSFIFLDKIGKKKEQNIWKQGIRTWNDFRKAASIKGIANEKKQYYNRKLEEAEQALNSDHHSHFIAKLPQIEMWRLYNECKDSCCFLDIEIDSYGNVVLAGISNYYETNFFVKGVNLETSSLQKELAKYSMVITFNGSSFDLPKLQKQFNIIIMKPHIDLKQLCINLGMKGGLKEVEKQLNLKRPQHLYGNPVSLWKTFHASGDREYLDLLLEYNREDCENLKMVMEWVWRQNSTNIFKP
ncbi:TPA: ribonuclease H-like domain-containing protein [Candidatus Woesearchaeota archaeon]|nr:hypothetical protein [archaeon]HIJ12089.1 ribonuclease H-like domain-containing protein [Candidatus Woesearchaeota archaeon]